MEAASPSDLYGELFARAQMKRLFADSKTLADVVALDDPAAIMRDYARERPGDDELEAFLRARFAPPRPPASPEPKAGGELRAHIARLWPELIRGPDAPCPGGSLLPIGHCYLVPGGRFRELYYWDSYFSMLGLIRDGHRDLAESMLDAFTDLIERHGHVPNGTRSYYLGRSQPPFYAMMAALLPSPDTTVTCRRLDAMVTEHGFWTADAAGLTPGEARGRSVAMANGSVLNRYWDSRDTPRDESYREDVATAAASARPAAQVCRDLRAGAESGWDFSSRWLAASGGLATIRTTRIVPIDLNAYLFALETMIARTARELGDQPLAARFERLAQARRRAVERFLWSEQLGGFADYDLARAAPVDRITAAALTPLFVGMAGDAQAASTAEVAERVLLAPGGLRTTTVETGEQWDAPNGWAPLQWMAHAGLARYGHRRLADEIARRWTEMVRAEFASSGVLHEKYDVERRRAGGGGEYAPQHGFGWTNGVTAAFIEILAEANSE